MDRTTRPGIPMRHDTYMRLLRTLVLLPRVLSGALRQAIVDADQRARLPGAIFGAGVLVRGADRITCGRQVFFDNRAYINSSVFNGQRGFIRIGNNVEVGPYTAIWGGGGVTIGNDVHIGAHVHITSMEGCQVPPDVNDPFAELQVDGAPVIVDDHVLICSGSVIVPGVHIGHHSMVAAGAVVTCDVPPYALVAGVPAKIVRYSTDHGNVTTGSIPA